MRRILFILFTTGLGFAALVHAPATAQTHERTEARAAAAVQNLRQLIKNRNALTRDLEQAEARRPLGETEQSRARRLDPIKAEIEALDEQIGAVATGVSQSDFFGEKSSDFDLNAELQALVEPFVVMMRDATDNARQIERLRRTLSDAKRRETLARRALETLKPVRAGAQDEALISELDAMRDEWERRANAAADNANALTQQLSDRLADRGENRNAANAAASGFFRERGLSLLLGFGAFIGVFLAMRLCRSIASWLRVRQNLKRNFQTRIANLMFTSGSVVLATGAMLAVFNARNDWLLLGIFAVMLLALAWIGIKMIPSAIEQISLLLNLGAVQEGERVLIDGVPYRVKMLDFYTAFENPDLEGSEYVLPVRALIGMHSRPSGPAEPWFPTRKGDWVRLADETYGRIISQSPEMVEIEIPGGSKVTYLTGEFLAQQPENLRGGFRAEIVFGIGYVHQAASTAEIMEKLAVHVRAGLLKLVSKQQLRAVDVEMLEAGDNAIVYEVEADLTGDAAPLLEDVERELTRLCVEACTLNRWEIPFPQLTLHQAR